MKQSHPLQRRVRDFIRQEQLLAGKDSVLAAVSGGPDSVALLHVLVSLREICGISKIAVLHFDHQLRGNASAADRDFVEALATSFDLPFHSGTEDVLSYHRRHKISVEMAARACRHRFFKEALTRLEAQAVALGHTANDQAEELLLRLIRGTGPGGMSGMHPRTQGGLIRPLLFATRKEIIAYLRHHELSFREDYSNHDPTYQRNALRHELFPVFEKHFHPRVVEVLCRHARLVEDDESCWRDLLASQWTAVCVAENPSRIVLSGQSLLDLHPAMQKRLLRRALERLRGNLLGIYAVHVEAIGKLLARRTPGRSIQLPGKIEASLEGKLLILSRESREPSSAILPEFSQTMSAPGCYRFPSFELYLCLAEVGSRSHPGPLPETPETCSLTPSPLWQREGLNAAPETIRMDAGKIQWPLFLRFWKNGDRFYPLGLGGCKKLQDFFVDSRVPRPERRRVPLLCDQEKICWIMGHRLDDRVKITPQTEQILIIEKRPGS